MLGQLGTTALLLVALVGIGLPVAGHVGERLDLPASTRVSLIPLAGLAFIGIATLAVGHLSLLGSWLPYALGTAGAVGFIAGLRHGTVPSLVASSISGLREQARRFPLQLGAVGFGGCLAVWASLAPPNRTDEVEYHWPAPLEWARAGEWTDSSYRHVDAFPFMEIVYTAAATQGSYVAAHVLHLTTLVALGLAAAGAARSLGATGTGAVASAAVAMPVAWDQAYAAYNDTAVGAFGAGAAAVVLGSRHARTQGIGVAALLLVVGISIKPTATAAVGLVGLVLLCLALLESDRTLHPVRRLLGYWLALGAAALATLTFWSWRQWMITGHWVDPAMTKPPSADALSRMPSDLQEMIAPLMPLVTGVVGAQEPWGGRTSLVLQIFILPALVYVVWARGRVLRRFTTLALPAWLHWVVLGFRGVRTRFHIVAWVLLVGSVRLAAEDASDRFPRARRWIEWTWTAAVLLAVLDVSMEMGRLIRGTWF